MGSDLARNIKYEKSSQNSPFGGQPGMYFPIGDRVKVQGLLQRHTLLQTCIITKLQ